MNHMSPAVAAAHTEASASAPGAPGSIHAPLGFIVRQREKPVFHSSALTGGAPKLFFEV